MIQLLTCAQGHFWEALAPEENSAPSTAVCPVCGSGPDSLPLLDLAPTEPRSPPVTAVVPEIQALPLRDDAGRPVVAGYEVQESLGRSPTGVARYRARQLLVGRTVLLKAVSAREDTGQIAWGSLRGEATALGKLSHPNIVTFYEAGERDRQLFYNALEYIEGPTLDEYLRGKPLSLPEAADLVEALARAVHHAHEQGVVHRNLQPSTVLLAPAFGGGGFGLAPASGGGPGSGRPPAEPGANWVPKIVGFGVARRPVEGETIDVELQTGLPCYLAPEQAWGRAREVGPGTDVYALGAILYELLTGQPPFPGNSPGSVLEQIQNKDLTPPSELRRLPRDLDAVCRRCLHKQPRRRYETALQLADDLARWSRGLPVKARPLSNAQRAGKWMRRRPLIPTLVVLTLGAVVAAVTAYSAGAGRGAADSRVLEQARQGERAAHLQAQRDGEARNAAEEREQNATYLYRLLLAERELSPGGQPNRARELLESCPSGPRNWEWHYLKHRSIAQTASAFKGNDGKAASSLAYSPDGKSLAIAWGREGNAQGEARVWDVRSRFEKLNVGPFAGPVHQVAYSPDGSRVAVLSGNAGDQAGELRLVDAFGAVKVHVPFANARVTSLAFRPNGERIAVGAGGALQLFVAATGAQVPLPPGARPPAPGQSLRVAFSPDGTHIATGGPRNQVKVYNASGNALNLGPANHADEVTALAYASDGRLASGSRDQTVKIWDAQMNLLRTLPHGGAVTALAFTADGKRLATASLDGTVMVWDTTSWELLVTLSGHTAAVPALAFSPQGSQLAIAHGNEVRLWGTSP
jgi:serine/threonine protein kinase